MKPEYDFSAAERGKFYHPNTQFNVPIYLDQDVLDSLHQTAESKGIDLNEMVNNFLRKNLDLLTKTE